VQLNGKPCRDPAHKLSNADRVSLDNRPLQLRGPRYLMLYKPQGYVCAARDDRHTTVLELLPAEEREGLHIAGRLDIDTTGLVLLTDDGDWSHRVTSPRHRCLKRYRVTLADPLGAEDLRHLREGVMLRGEQQPTRPAEVVQLDDRSLYLSIEEGRYHQVKRMFGALGNRVVALHRDRIGSVDLEAAGLAPGEFRALSVEDVAALG
jgi:16S rRNA pseudouridine516 synthase